MTEIDYCLRFLVRVMPRNCQVRLRVRYPEWFLPEDIILKVKMEDKADLFETELKAYERLRPLQGDLVPFCYGVAAYDNKRSFSFGISLSDAEGLTLPVEKVLLLLQACYERLHAMCAHQEDMLLSNFRLVEGEIVAVDFDLVKFDPDPEVQVYLRVSIIESLLDIFVRLQEEFIGDGLLEVIQESMASEK
jgi:hypothetical protein